MRVRKTVGGVSRRWTAKEWEAFRRGYESGKVLGRQEAPKAIGPDRLLRVRDVMRLTGLGRTTLWQLERDGRFPKRRRIADAQGRAVAWRASDVARWIAARKSANEA